jgi:fructose-1,6-bisphosphatase/inositol monophosphatase family enzyme
VESSRRLLKARRWVRVAGREALDRFGQVDPTWKDAGGLVTETDRSIETYLRRKISNHFPNDAVVGEEFSDEGRSDPDCRWYLDPIDGTAAYSMDLPVWCVSVGLASKYRPEAGILLAPGVEEEYWGKESEPFRKNDRSRTVDRVPADEWTSESLLCVTSDAHRRFSIDFPGKCRSLGSSAFHLALVLDGRAVGAILNRLHVWDLAAIVGMTSEDDDCVLRTFEGDKPDWERLADGRRSTDNLLFAPEAVVPELLNRVDKTL